MIFVSLFSRFFIGTLVFFKRRFVVLGLTKLYTSPFKDIFSSVPIGKSKELFRLKGSLFKTHIAVAVDGCPWCG